MGCDIHVCTEVKIDGKWHYYGNIEPDRDYQLFGKICGVRDDCINPIVPIKGHPEDLDFMTLQHLKFWNEDAHSKTWLNSDEIDRLCKWYEQRPNSVIGFEKFCDTFGFVFGSSWVCGKRYSQRPHEIYSDVRWIIWFDN